MATKTVVTCDRCKKDLSLSPREVTRYTTNYTDYDKFKFFDLCKSCDEMLMVSFLGNRSSLDRG